MSEWASALGVGVSVGVCVGVGVKVGVGVGPVGVGVGVGKPPDPGRNATATANKKADDPLCVPVRIPVAPADDWILLNPVCLRLSELSFQIEEPQPDGPVQVAEAEPFQYPATSMSPLTLVVHEGIDTDVLKFSAAAPVPSANVVALVPEYAHRDINVVLEVCEKLKVTEPVPTSPEVAIFVKAVSDALENVTVAPDGVVQPEADATGNGVSETITNATIPSPAARLPGKAIVCEDSLPWLLAVVQPTKVCAAADLASANSRNIAHSARSIICR